MHKSRGGRDNNSDMPVANKIFTEQYKGIELNCLVGNIMECSNTAIGIICDSRFVLNGGLGRSIKETAGAEFMANLQMARGVQQNTTAIAVQSTRNLRSSHVILYPIRSVDRDVLDRAYVGIFNKAIELQIPTLTIPLLGTGQLGLSIDAAINYLRTAISQMSNFGHIQKLQFIDRNENTMLSLISGYLNQLIQGQNSGGASTSQQQPQGHNSGSSSSNSFLAIGSGASDSPIQLYPRIHHNDHRLSDQGTSSNSNATQFSSALHTGSSSINLNISINLGGGTTDEDEMDDENEDLSFADTGDDNDGNSDNDNEDDSDSDLEDSSDEDGGFSSDDTIWSTNTDESQQMDATNSAADETAYEMMQRIAEEKTFWKKITLDELAKDNEAEDEQLFQQPMSSSSSRLKAKEKTKARLDDTTMPCSICLSDMREEQENTDAIVQLTLCSHMYHEECIRAAFKVKKQCPLCMCFYGNPIGCQPLNATMHDRQISGKVPGHPDANGYHEITYHIPSGVQTENHPRPGEPYRSSTRIAYLPNNAEGTEVLKLLKLAFKRRLIFTIGDSVTTGRKNVPVWNGIHHKTNKDGGEHCYGYPDPHYLQRVKEELAMVGVCSDQL